MTTIEGSWENERLKEHIADLEAENAAQLERSQEAKRHAVERETRIEQLRETEKKFEAQVVELTRERDELERLYGSEFNMNNELIGVRAELNAALATANDKVLRVVRGEFGQICSYCGWKSPPAGGQWEDLQAHIQQCEKHPAAQLAAAQARIVELLAVGNEMFGWFRSAYSEPLESKRAEWSAALATPDDTAALDRALAAERERCAKVCADHPGHIPSNKWNASSALGSCEQAIRSMKT